MYDRIPFNKNSEINLAVTLGVALALIVAVSLIFSSAGERGDISTPSEVVKTPFPEVFIGAKAAYVYDIRNGEVLFSKNPDEGLPLASLTKVMTALTAYEAGEAYGTVTVDGNALAVEGDSGLYNGERWSLKKLLDFSMVTSSNDGMRAVALSLGALNKSEASPEEIVGDFVGMMNRKATELGFENMRFLNETGLDLPAQEGEQAKAGGYGSARDMSALMQFVLENHPEILEYTNENTLSFTSLNGNTHIATNTNPLVAEIPGLLASKTGYTGMAGGNLSVIFDPELGRPIVITVLGSTLNGRFEDVRTLVNATMEYIKEN